MAPLGVQSGGHRAPSDRDGIYQSWITDVEAVNGGVDALVFQRLCHFDRFEFSQSIKSLLDYCLLSYYCQWPEKKLGLIIFLELR